MSRRAQDRRRELAFAPFERDESRASLTVTTSEDPVVAVSRVTR